MSPSSSPLLSSPPPRPLASQLLPCSWGREGGERLGDGSTAWKAFDAGCVAVRSVISATHSGCVLESSAIIAHQRSSRSAVDVDRRCTAVSTSSSAAAHPLIPPQSPPPHPVSRPCGLSLLQWRQHSVDTSERPIGNRCAALCWLCAVHSAEAKGVQRAETCVTAVDPPHMAALYTVQRQCTVGTRQQRSSRTWPSRHSPRIRDAPAQHGSATPQRATTGEHEG